MKYLPKTLYTLLFVVLTSCIFVGEEENFVNVEQVVNPAFKSSVLYSLNSNSFVNNPFAPLLDTLRLYSAAYIRLEGIGLYDYQISIDNQVVRAFGSEPPNYNFLLQKGNRAVGKYVLKIVQRSKSGTGSLADNAGLEYAEHTSTYVLIIDNNVFQPQINSVAFKDGTVEVTWKKYPLGDFQEYVLSAYSSWNESVPFKKHTFTDREKIVFKDTTYGRSAYYAIGVKRGGETISSYKYEFGNTYKSGLRLEKGSAPNTIRAYWRPPVYYKNVVSYHLYPYGSMTPLFTNVPATAGYAEFQSTMKFGQTSGFSFGFLTHGGDANSEVLNASIGKKIRSFVDLDYNESLSSYFSIAYNPQTNGVEGLYRYNSSYKTLDSLVFYSPAAVAVSPNGNHAHLMRGATITSLSPTNFQSSSAITLLNMGLSGYMAADWGGDHFAVSNTNYLLLRTSEQVVIIDMNTKTPVLQMPATVGPVHLSSNHQYFIKGSTLYEFSGGTYTVKGTLPYTPTYVQFINGSTNRVVVGTDNRIAVFDCDSFTEVTSKAFAAGISWVHYDQFSQVVTFIKSGMLIEMNLNTLAEVPLDVFSASSEYVVEGGKLFYGWSGYMLENYH